MKLILAASVIALFLLVGCDSESPEATQAAAKPDLPKENMFSKEQELIRQAQGVEKLLAEDADAKKKAVSDELGSK